MVGEVEKEWAALKKVAAKMMEEHLVRLIDAHINGRCIETEKNAICGNPGPDVLKGCISANRPLLCN